MEWNKSLTISFILRKGKTTFTQKTALAPQILPDSLPEQFLHNSSDTGTYVETWTAQLDNISARKICLFHPIFTHSCCYDKSISRLLRNLFLLKILISCFLVVSRVASKIIFYLEIYSNRNTYYIVRNSLSNEFLSYRFIIRLVLYLWRGWQMYVDQKCVLK